MWSKQSTKATRLPPLSPSCHVCMLMFSFCIYPSCSFFISWCVYACVCFCLPGCWTNSREIILPQSPSLSGQSDEELVIFNTGEGGGRSSIREAKLPVCECRSPSYFSLCFPPLSILFHSGIIPKGSDETEGTVEQSADTEELWR